MSGEEYKVRTYSNEVLNVKIGNKYGGEGYSGITDGVDVKGILTEVDDIHSSATIINEKGVHCAIKLRSLYEISNNVNN